ncbi:MAG: hypothetical protein IAE91_11855 [Ignavibacteriaceae bacterium]|nr:hypothetical protein [Ignavibacteriaceae bacterium]
MKTFTAFFSVLVLAILVTIPAKAQEVDDYLYKIDLKLRKDKKYLNLSYYDFFGTDKFLADLGSLPRTQDKPPLSFKNSDAVTYRVVFLKDGVGMDTLVLLYINEIVDQSVADEGIFGSGQAGVAEQMVMPFNDMYNLMVNHYGQYSRLYNYLDRLQKIDPEFKFGSLLGIVPDDDISTSLGITSRDNTDYVNFMSANYLHWYPKMRKAEKGRRGETTATTISYPYRLDAGLTSISFSHQFMDFSLGGASVELNLEEPVLNILPYSGGVLGFGFRTLISVTDDKKELNNSLMVDARVLGRVILNTKSVIDKLKFVLDGDSKLNLSTAVGLDIHTTRPFGLPFLNLYAMVGSPGYSDPFIRIQDTKSNRDYAYFSFKQAEASMSFYWNTSDKLTARFRLDVGVGYYDIYKAEYNRNAKTIIRGTNKLIVNLFSPVVTLYFNFAPDGSELFGGKFRIFDSQVKAEGWIKLVEFPGGHNIRAAAAIVSGPIARGKQEWESEGGAMFQVRYRYGF